MAEETKKCDNELVLHLGDIPCYFCGATLDEGCDCHLELEEEASA